MEIADTAELTVEVSQGSNCCIGAITQKTLLVKVNQSPILSY